MTLEEMKAAVRNHMKDGRSGAFESHDYSVEQIEEEIITQRNRLIQKYSLDQVKLNKKYCMQTVDNVPVRTIDMAQKGPFDSGFINKGITIPKVQSTTTDDAIEFLGDVKKVKGLKVYYDKDFHDHEYRPFTNKTPFAWLDVTPNKDGTNTVYLMNLDRYTPRKYVSIRYILSDPRQHPQGLGQYEEFPCPGWMQDEIISILTERYVRYYRMMNIPPMPNIQADPS